MNEPLPEYMVVGEGHSTLVFLHGLGGDHTNWQPQFAEFASDYRCVAWTLPGYGLSPPLEALTWPNLSDMFASDYDERVDRLVLAATSSEFGRGSASFSERFLAARLKPLDDGSTPADLAPDVVRSLLSSDAPPDAVTNCVASMSRISADAYRAALRCLVTWDFTDHLHDISVPTLCLAGADDVTAPVAALRALAEGLPDAQFAVIDNCNHLMNLDRPVEFNRLTRQFLNAH